MTTQTWTVLEWGAQDGGLLGAIIVCVDCSGSPPPEGCPMCGDRRYGDPGDGTLFQPYYLPNGAPIDLDRDAEILIQIEPRGKDCPDV